MELFNKMLKYTGFASIIIVLIGVLLNMLQYVVLAEVLLTIGVGTLAIIGAISIIVGIVEFFKHLF